MSVKQGAAMPAIYEYLYPKLTDLVIDVFPHEKH
jgi:hypothetical protein